MNCSSDDDSSKRGDSKFGEPTSVMNPRSRVSDLRLVLVNFVVAGLEIASSVAFTFIPPLLLKSGYSETQMSIIFGIGKFVTFKK